MPVIKAEWSSRIEAPVELVYSILADYRIGHPIILPPPYLSGLEVVEGGTGAGTRIRYKVTLMGRTMAAEAVVSEPDPGRVLVETDVNTGVVTTFVVEGVPGRDDCHVTITTEWATPGIRGIVEGWMAPPLLRKVYRLELANLECYARSRQEI